MAYQKKYILPLNIEIKVDSKREIRSETDLKGIITYANDYFIELSGFSGTELMSSPHNINRHPDMPKIVFKTLWDNLKEGKKYKAIVKNLRKDGKYYWVYSDYEPILDELGNPKGYLSYRRPVSRKSVEEVEGIYKKLLEIEKKQGVNESGIYLQMKLEELGFPDYYDLIEHVRKSKLENLFGFFGKLFGKK